MMQLLPPRVVPVYRKNQSTLWSPCMIGHLCPSCRQHSLCRAGNPCRRCKLSKPAKCDRAVPAEPAFGVTRREAITLIYAGLAIFALDNTAIQLTFTRVENLRDASSKADEEFIFAFLAGSRAAALALELGWSLPPETVEASAPTLLPFPFV